MIEVYSGRGSSHSWTWLARLFDANKVHDVRFAAADDVPSLASRRPDAFIVSGGDGFGIASAIGTAGFDAAREFTREGGSYIGICAGAYLALRSSVAPFRDFSISTTKILNIRPLLNSDSSEDPRKAVRYGSCAIHHPLRGDMWISDGHTKMMAPLFGGPIFKEPARDRVLFRYSSLGGQVALHEDRDSVEAMVIGAPAVIEATFGRGRAVLLSPHLEHPRYEEANAEFLRMFGIVGRGGSRSVECLAVGTTPSVAQAIADLKVTILGLENSSFVVGRKVWDGGKMLELVSAISDWAPSLEGKAADTVESTLRTVREALLAADSAAALLPDEAPQGLVEAARVCANEHFAAKRR